MPEAGNRDGKAGCRECYNGVAWGVEPSKGTAKIRLDRWSVTYL
ncbi:hypothetical protein [uncultured Sphingomonas sp.]|nr:hypothetical protein [uncultured Sphingomonas sp.]